MKKTLLLLAALVLISAMILTACGGSPAPTTTAPTNTSDPTSPATTPASPVAEKTWKLKFHTEQSTESFYHRYGHEPWAKDVAEATNGRVTVEFYPLQSLMKSQNALDGVKTGVADVSWIFTGYFSGIFDISDSITLPYLAPDGETASRVAWALYEKYPEIQEVTKDYKVLSVWTSEPYFFISHDKFYKTPADLEGQKMRMPGGNPTEMMKLLKGTPMMIGMPDTYLNLQKGVINGMAAPAEAVDGYKLYEVAPYFTYIPTTTVYFLLIMNKQVWESMPKDIQDAIMSVSGEKQAIRYGGGVFDGARKELPAIIQKAGAKIQEYTVPEADIAKFRDVSGQPLYEAWVKKMTDKGFTNAQAIMDDTIKLAQQFASE